MSYNPICLNDLVALADVLSRIYKGSNQERLLFITRFKNLVMQTTKDTDLSQEQVIHILLGALAYELGEIKLIEYKGRSPKKRSGYFWSSGSDLYTEIKSRLNITKNNKYGYDERLADIYEYYNYIDNKWTNKELSKRVKTVLDLVLKRNSEDLYNLVHGVPVLNVLLKNLAKLETEYAANSYNPTNPARLELLNCIKFILYSYQNSNPTDVSWHVCSGALLVALLKIESEYKVLSPTRSTLFRECLNALNQESLDKIPIDDKIKWLRTLSSHITMVSGNLEKYNWVLKQVVADTKNQNLDTTILEAQLNNFQNSIEKFLTVLGEKKNTPSYATTIIETGTSYAFQSATAQFVFQTTRDVILGGILSTAIFGAAGTFLMSGLGKLVADGIVSSITAGLFGWILVKIGNSVGSMTATVITYPFSATPKGLEEMRMKLKPMDDIAFVRMVNTMLEMDSIVEDDKKHIRALLGLDVGEKLKPLLTSIILDEEEKKMQDAVRVEGYATRYLNDYSDNSSEEEYLQPVEEKPKYKYGFW